MYYKLIRISMKSRLQYRADFFIGIANVFVLNGVNLALIGILLHRFHSLHGWNIWDMFFLYSLFMIGHSIYSLLFWHFNAIDDFITKGTFDQFLLRPLSPLIQFLGREIQPFGFGDVAVGVITFAIAFQHEGLHWPLWKWLYLILAIASGTAVEMAIRWAIAASAFWFGRSVGFTIIANRLNLLVQQYPIDVFGNWFRLAVTVIPVAFMNYYPSLVLLGKSNGIGSWLGLLSPVTAVLAVFAAWLIWRQGLKVYTSSGS